MEDWILNIVLTFIIAFSLTGMLIPQILIIAFRKKLFDTHDARKIHEGIVPTRGYRFRTRYNMLSNIYNRLEITPLSRGNTISA